MLSLSLLAKGSLCAQSLCVYIVPWQIEHALGALALVCHSANDDMLSDNVWVCGGGGAAVGGRLVALNIWSMHAENWYLAKNTQTQWSNDDNASFGFQIENEGTWQCYSCARPFVSPYRMLVPPPTTLSHSVTSKCLANYDICHFLCGAWSAVPPTPHLDWNTFWHNVIEGLGEGGWYCNNIGNFIANSLIWQSFRQGDNPYGNCFLLYPAPIKNACTVGRVRRWWW